MRLRKAPGATSGSERALVRLTRFEPFQNLSAPARALLSQGLVVSSSASTAPVLYKGQIVSGAYLVLNGKLRVFTIAPSGV